LVCLASLGRGQTGSKVTKWTITLSAGFARSRKNTYTDHCHACKRTFTESQGTPLPDLKYPVWVVVLVLTRLAHGCPVAVIVAAFVLDARSVLAWQSKAGAHAEQIQATGVCNGGLELGQV
jgi:transposase-like protein